MGNISTPAAFTGPSRSQDPYAGGVMTKHGWFSAEDLRGVHHRFVYDRNGERVLQFPYSVTVIGEPMYRGIPDHVVRERETEGAQGQNRAA
ncbi:MAG: hypothetical protein KC442_11940 [Thermomicrobiales bacterium]|nr:hypothetical protein [Thermomicrobiales bacterium]MCB0059169.1 hypothetical protein [Caldilineaceae bacterium]